MEIEVVVEPERETDEILEGKVPALIISTEEGTLSPIALTAVTVAVYDFPTISP